MWSRYLGSLKTESECQILFGIRKNKISAKNVASANFRH